MIEINDSSYLFSKGSAGSLLIGQGWKKPEIWGIKSSALISELQLPKIALDVGGKLSISFYCNCQFETSVYFNETLVATWSPSYCFVERVIDVLDVSAHTYDVTISLKFHMKVVEDFELQSLWIDGGTFVNQSLSQNIEKNTLYDMSREPVIFFTGMPRSGTSIAYKVARDALGLTAHSLIESFFFPWAFSKFEDQFAGDCAQAFLGENLAEIFNEIRSVGLVSSNYDDVLNLARYYYSLVALQNEGRGVVDKTPEHIFYWQAIKESIPHSKICFFSRSPVEIYASYKKRKTATDPTEPNASDDEWLLLDCHQFAESYKQHLEAAQALIRRHGDSTLHVQYDQFVRRDPLVIEQFSKFIGCDLSTVYAVLDKPIFENDKIASVLHSGVLVENKIDVQQYLQDSEIDILRNISVL